MKDISKVEIKIETEYLKNKVKEIRNLRDKKMSKKSKMTNEKELPIAIEPLPPACDWSPLAVVLIPSACDS